MYHIVQFKYVQLIDCQSHPNKDGHTKEREKGVWPHICWVSFREEKLEISSSESRMEPMSIHNKLGLPLAMAVKLERKKWVDKMLWEKQSRSYMSKREEVMEEAGQRECWVFFLPHKWMELPWWRVLMEGVQWDHSWGSGTWNMVRGNHCGDVRQVAGNVEVKAWIEV